MMNQIAHRSQLPPTPADLKIIRYFPPDYVALLALIDGNEELPAGMSLSNEVRTRMTTQADRLAEIMGDKRPRDETKAVMVLLSSFPRQAGNEGATDILYEAYGMACEEVPTWAIEEAVRRWITGKCGAQHWAPSPPELRVAADHVVKLAKGKIISLRRLAAATTPRETTPAEKLRVTEALQGVFSHNCVGERTPLPHFNKGGMTDERIRRNDDR